MTWWDDLWLNESFAEWMEAKAVDQLHPDWRILLWEASGRQAALKLDAGPATHPVVQPAETLDQVEAIGDAITYDKGASVIRMLEAHVGQDAWREGVRAFLRQHAYGNATRADLWSAIEAAAHRPITGMAQDFTEQAGVPMINAEIMAGQAPGSGLFLIESQLGAPPAPRGWRVPVAARPLGDGPIVQMVVRPGSLIHALRSPDPGPLVVNPGQTGYFRTLYSPSAFTPLLQRLGKLDPADQLGLIDDSWALGQAGEAPADRFMALVDRLPVNGEARVWSQTLEALAEVDLLYRGQPGQAKFRAWLRRKLEPLLARVGWSPGSAATDRFAMLRPALLTTLAELDDPVVLAEARRRFARFQADPAGLPAGIREAVLSMAGASADTRTFEVLRRMALDAADPQAQRQFMVALSGAKDSAIAQKALDLSLSPEVPPSLSQVMIRAVAAEHPDLAWAFAVAHKDALAPRLDPSLQLSFFPRLLRGSSDAARADALHAFAEKAYPPASRSEAAKAEAEVRRKAEVRVKRLPEIDRWLARAPKG